MTALLLIILYLLKRVLHLHNHSSGMALERCEASPVAPSHHHQAHIWLCTVQAAGIPQQRGDRGIGVGGTMRSRFTGHGTPT